MYQNSAVLTDFARFALVCGVPSKQQSYKGIHWHLEVTCYTDPPLSTMMTCKK